MFEILSYQGSEQTPLKYGRLWNPDQPESGKPLWFVPGLGGSVKGALPFLNALLPYYSPIYAADLRGFGINPLDTPLYRAPVIQQDLEAFYQEIIAPHHAEQPLALCGISLGGVLSTLLATEHPDWFNQLILLAPAYKPNASSFSLGYVLRNTFNHLVLREKARTSLPYGLERVTQNPAILQDPQFDGALRFDLTPGFLLGVRSLSQRAFRQLKQLHTPTLMVIPGQDLVCCPSKMDQAFERIPNSTPKKRLHYPHFHHDVLFEVECKTMAQEILAWSLTNPS